MRPGGAIVGLSQTHSVIAPASSGFAAVGAPLLRTPPGAAVTIAFVGLVTWWHIPAVFTLDWQAKQGLWRSNYESRVCECMWLSDATRTQRTASSEHGPPPTARRVST